MSEAIATLPQNQTVKPSKSKLMSVFYSHKDLNEINCRQSVLNIICATDQVRLVSFGKERRFQAIDLRCENGRWQVQDSDQKWYSTFFCE